MTAVDRELVAALVALSAPSIEKRVSPHFDAGGKDLDVVGLCKATETMSTSEIALVEVAIACWRGSGPIDMWKLTSLDERNARRAIAALAVRLGLLDNSNTVTLDLTEELA
jgi:hypothetical protein